MKRLFFQSVKIKSNLIKTRHQLTEIIIRKYISLKGNVKFVALYTTFILYQASGSGEYAAVSFASRSAIRRRKAS